MKRFLTERAAEVVTVRTVAREFKTGTFVRIGAQYAGSCFGAIAISSRCSRVTPKTRLAKQIVERI